MKKTHDYIHHYRGYWSDGGRCRIQIYQEDGHVPVVLLTSTTGLQHLPALRLRVVLERNSSRRSHRSDAGKARATLVLEGDAA